MWRKALGTLGLFGIAAGAVAHEKWFEDPRPYPFDLSNAMNPLALGLIATMLVLVAVLYVLKRRFPNGFLPSFERFGASHETLERLYGLIPLILGVHVAVPLLVSGVTGRLFSPDNVLPGAWRYFIGLAETGLALAFVYGGLTRMAAVALGVLWLIGVFIFGPEPMLDNAIYLGFAAFFYLAGRGPLSIDRLVIPKFAPSPELMRKAVPALRIGLGVSLTFVAFSEKFANVPLAEAFLQRFPLNFTHALGIGMSNQTFIYAAGSVELLVGLCLLFNLFPREIVLIAWIPINMSLTVFNWTELVGHLPIYGIMALLLVWPPTGKDETRWVHGLQGGAVESH